jgi:hypothetical protein
MAILHFYIEDRQYNSENKQTDNLQPIIALLVSIFEGEPSSSSTEARNVKKYGEVVYMVVIIHTSQSVEFKMIN